MSFSGFPPGAIEFFRKIRNNNNREWFNQHKSDYIQMVLEPAVGFVGAFGEQLRTLFPDIRYDPRTNGSGSVMRIYRDTRFSKDKTPYKTWLGIVFWLGNRKKTDNPGFFLGLDHEGARLHCGWHGLPKAVLAGFREAVADNDTGHTLVKLLDRLRDNGYEIGEPHYKRVPRDYDPEHPRAELLKHADLGVTSPPIPGKELESPALIQSCMGHVTVMAPVFRWLVDLDRSVSGEGGPA